MSNYVRVPGLVAERMSLTLANKFWQKPDPYEIHINADGDNSTADGTKENPFANFTNAVSFSLDRFIPRSNKAINLIFDSDYTAGATEYTQISGMTGNYYINGNGHNVKLHGIYIYNQGGGECTLDGLVFEQIDGLRMIVSSGAGININNCTFIGQANTALSPIFVENHGKINIGKGCGITFKGASSPAVRVFMIARKSYLRFNAAFNVTDESADDHSNPLLWTNCNSLFYITQAMNGSWKGKKFYLQNGSGIITDNHGADYIAGDKAGEIADPDYSYIA